MLGIQTNHNRATDHRRNAAWLRSLRPADYRHRPAHLADSARWHELQAWKQDAFAVLKVCGWLVVVAVAIGVLR